MQCHGCSTKLDSDHYHVIVDGTTECVCESYSNYHAGRGYSDGYRCSTR